jgi:hypothetical protein
MKEKNVKIPEVIHDELKLFAVREKISMTLVAENAIIEYMASHGHKLNQKIKSSKANKVKT